MDFRYSQRRAHISQPSLLYEVHEIELGEVRCQLRDKLALGNLCDMYWPVAEAAPCAACAIFHNPSDEMLREAGIRSSSVGHCSRGCLDRWPLAYMIACGRQSMWCGQAVELLVFMR